MASRMVFAPAAMAARRAQRSIIAPSRSYATKQAGPTSQFYKTFTRPVAKVLLIAVFTYQVAYWSWVKLETDEARAESAATISSLEATINEYQDSKQSGTKQVSQKPL